MSERSKEKKPGESPVAPEDTGGELSEEQLDDVAGGIIIVGGSVQQSSDSGELLGWATFPSLASGRSRFESGDGGSG